LLAAAFAALASGHGLGGSSPGPAAAAPVAAVRTHARPLALAGKLIGIDPGHNGANGTDPSWLNHPVWNGREQEGCDTTGTQTAGGYTESQFNWNVATDLVADLRRLGARVVLTRHTNTGRGPCVDKRAEILDHARVAVAIDIHADGGPSDGRGFAILEPVPDGPNDRVIKASERLGLILRSRFAAVTRMPTSTYDGVHGITLRDDLAGLNLTTVPKVLIECGNMTNSTDAALLTRRSWQRRAALAMTEALRRFLQR
jgi:N-acetylmuramoyl-L-alanine amidase